MVTTPKKNNKIKKSVEKHPHKIDLHPVYTLQRTLGQKAADALTVFVGSWTFILLTVVLIAGWISVNTVWLLFGASWDPYPFIVLNLALSTLAALQAPIILMSQNRQSEIDRRRAEYDYKINRKAAREINEMRIILSRIYGKKLEKRRAK